MLQDVTFGARRICFSLRALTTIAFSLTNVLAADSPTAMKTGDQVIQDNDILMLDRFVVTADRVQGPPWRYTTIPGYEILSRCKDSETKDWILRLLRGNEEMAAMLPDGCLSELGSPVGVILYNTDNDSGPIAAAVPNLGSASIDQALLGWGQNMGTSPGSRVEDLDTIDDCLRLPSFRQFFMGSFHMQPTRAVSFGFRLRRRVPEFPPWLIEGLIGPNGLYTHHATVWSEEDKAPCMFISMARWISKDDTRWVVEHKRSSVPFVPLPSLLTMNASEEQNPNSPWSSEAALFVRWGLFGANEGEASDPRRFWTFVNQCTSGANIETAFRGSFGFGYDEMQDRLEKYLPKAINDLLKIRLSIDWTPNTPDLRDATPAETGRIIGDWERLKGESYLPTNIDLSHRLFLAASKIMSRSISKSPHDPQLLGAMGLLDYIENDSTNAIRNLEEASDAHITRPTIYLRLAQLRYDDFMGKTATSALTSAQVKQVVGPLLVAEAQPPALRETYQLLAETCLHGQSPPEARTLAAIDEGGRLFPFDREYSTLLQKIHNRWVPDK
jgi:hypothetical protein